MLKVKFLSYFGLKVEKKARDFSCAYSFHYSPFSKAKVRVVKSQTSVGP